MYALLRLMEKLRRKMANKYNITNSTEFDDFVREASEAVQMKNKLDWTYSNACRFVVATLTTVGKLKYMIPQISSFL